MNTTPTELRLAFWRTLPGHLPPGACLRATGTGSFDRIAFDDGAVVLLEVKARGGELYVSIDECHPHREGTVEKAVAFTVRRLGEIVECRRVRAAKKVRLAEQAAEAKRLTATSGVRGSRMIRDGFVPCVEVTPDAYGLGFEITTQVPMSGADVEAVFALLRERGVLRAVPIVEEAPGG